MADRRYALLGHSHAASATAWGSITGTLSAQTDLQSALDAKAPTSHTHSLTDVTDVTALAAELNLLDLSGLTAGWVLSADTATTASWKAPAGGGLSNIVEDVSPQLGGNLDLNSKTVNGTGTIGITGAITATSYGGITEANLLDKTASENISGATWNFQDNNVTRPLLTDYSVENAAASVTTNAVTLAYGTAQSRELDLEDATGDVTVTISGGPPAGTYGEMIVKVQQDTTADRTLTWAGGTFVWPGGTEVEPKTGSDAITIYYLSTWDAGTTWYINGVEYGA